MRSHVIFARLAAGIGCGAMLAGCGGGGSAPASGPTNGIGGTTKQAGSAAPSAVVVPATNGTAQTIMVGGAPVQAVIPSGAPTNVPTGTPLAVIGAGSAIVHGTFAAGTVLTVNGVTLSGITIDTAGNIIQNVALPVDTTAGTFYSITIPQGAVAGRVLTVHNGIVIKGKFYFRNGNVVSPVPNDITGVIPNNGQNAVGSTVTATFGAGNDGRTAELTIDYGNGFILDQTRVIQGSKAVFSDLTTDSSNVPSNGVSTVTFTVGP